MTESPRAETLVWFDKPAFDNHWRTKSRDWVFGAIIALITVWSRWRPYRACPGVAIYWKSRQICSFARCTNALMSLSSSTYSRHRGESQICEGKEILHPWPSCGTLAYSVQPNAISTSSSRLLYRMKHLHPTPILLVEQQFSQKRWIYQT